MVVLNLDHEAFAQQWLSPESEPLLFWFNGGRARTFPSTPVLLAAVSEQSRLLVRSQQSARLSH
jgi:hypothetical protein